MSFKILFYFFFNWNRSNSVHNPFKVDLHNCLSIEGNYLDISSIEFKKHGKEQRVVKIDGCKILAEAKSIISQMIKQHNLDFEKLLITFISLTSLINTVFLTMSMIFSHHSIEFFLACFPASLTVSSFILLMTKLSNMSIQRYLRKFEWQCTSPELLNFLFSA